MCARLGVQQWARHLESCPHGFFSLYLTFEGWRGLSQVLRPLHVFGDVIHYQGFPSHRLLVTPKLRRPSQTRVATNSLSSQWITDSTLPKPGPSPTFLISLRGIKRGQNRGIVLGSCIPHPQLGTGTFSSCLTPQMTASNWTQSRHLPPSGPVPSPPLTSGPQIWPWLNQLYHDQPNNRTGEGETVLGVSCLGSERCGVHGERCWPSPRRKQADRFQTVGRL